MSNSPTGQAGNTLTPEYLADFAKRYAATWNAQPTPTAEPLMKLVTDDIRWADPLLPAPAQGRKAVADLMLASFRTFPDLTCDILDPPYLSADGKRVMFHWRLSGTFKGPLPNGIPPNGKRMSIEGVDRWEFRGGLISDYQAFYDLAALLKQLGLMPG
jgi:steroid delta-isomerase-like uncharacterized protein